MARHFSIDSLAIRNARAFGWGWFLDTDSRMRSGHLYLRAIDGSEIAVPCLDGAVRTDVEAAFPDVEHAATCGFMLMAALPSSVDRAQGARFVAELCNGERHEIHVNPLPLAEPETNGPAVLRRLVARLRSDGPAAVAGVLLRHAADRYARSVESWKLQRQRASPRPTTIVFDHDMGGGANVYRERLVARIVESGMRVAVVTPQLAALDYEIRVVDATGDTGRWREADESSLVASLERMDIAAIELNNLVGFTDPVRLIRWCAARRARGARLTFHLHDFHAVCPAFTLIDADGRYCGVPALDACRACLPRNVANSMGLGQGVDPAEWRAAWSGLLAAADEVVVFSDASARIVERAYPELVASPKVVVRPHQGHHAHLRPVRRDPGEILRIGVIGNISRPKGADIVSGIVSIARERGLALQVVVIGTLQASVPAGPHLAIHGRFDAAELPDLVERYGIDVCLMPSICPETYSFVTDEAMAMGLPLAVFDLGAPAERVSRYAYGEIIPQITADAALASIMRLAQRAEGPVAASEERSSG